MTVASSVLDAIGNTPLIRLRRASEATGCEILGKAEFMNPGASVKDRAALYIVRDAERRGLLKPGGRIVEGTAGNGLVKVSISGAGEVQSLNIDPQVVDPDDVETLQDLVIGAFQAAIDNLQQLSQEKMGPLSQGLGGFGF